MSRKRHIDYGLKFLHQIMGLKALHLGMWTDEMPRTLGGVPAAQQLYTETLIGFIPEGVRTVLDIGCGSGDTSRQLIAAGFGVEGLSPDAYHGELYAETNGKDVPFHLAKFEDCRPGKTYDCLLFSESAQYVDKDRLFPKCLELTRPGGHVVASDFFQIAPCEEYHMCFVEEDFVARGERAGFKVTAHRDITADVVPTQDVSLVQLRHAQAAFQFALDAARNEAPVLWKLVRMFLGKKIEAVRQLLYEKLPPRLDPKRFLDTVRYAIYRMTREG